MHNVTTSKNLHLAQDQSDPMLTTGRTNPMSSEIGAPVPYSKNEGPESTKAGTVRSKKKGEKKSKKSLSSARASRASTTSRKIPIVMNMI